MSGKAKFNEARSTWPVPARAVRHDLSARQGTVLAVCAIACVCLLDLLDGSLGFAFGMGFVLTVMTVALWVDVNTLFTPGIAPPFLMLAAVIVVAIIAPTAIDVSAASGDPALMERILAGVLNQATALVIGHVGALIIIALRRLSAANTSIS